MSASISDLVCSNSVETFTGDKMNRYLSVQSHPLAEWLILCFDGSFLKAPLNPLKRTEEGTGPSVDLCICSSVLGSTELWGALGSGDTQ